MIDASLLDRHVNAFEMALRHGAPNLDAYLPARQSPVYADVLVELLRVDLEWHWREGTPRGLEEYRQRYPEAFSAPAHRAALEAEDARLRQRFAPADTGATRVVAEPQVAAQLPQAGGYFLDFRLVAELGRGAFGRVFLAHQGGLAERPVALKVALDLDRESQTLAQLQHTNIVPIYSVHRAAGLHAVCMPFCGGTTLGDVYGDLLLEKNLPLSGQALVSTWRERRTRTALTPAEAEVVAPEPAATGVETPFHQMARLSYTDAVLWLAARLADGLAHAHERGILHRDLKPANILLADDGEPMLLDFNLAADSKERATVASVGGTLQYMSPEQMAAFSGQPTALTPASDIFALGVILYEMLTGLPPFPANKGVTMPELLWLMQEDRSKAPPSPRTLNPSISPAVAAIVLRCLQPDSKARYQSARDLAEDLRRQLDHRPLKHTPEPSLVERVQKFRRRHPRLVSLTSGLVAVAVVGITLGVALHSRSERVATLEALDAARQLHDDRVELEFLLTTRAAPTRVQEALDRSAAARARFPEGRLQRLPEGERSQAEADLRDVAWLSAQAHLLRVNPLRPNETQADLDQAEKFVDDAVRGQAETPLAVRLQQARLARLRGDTARADALDAELRTTPPQNAGDWYRLAFASAEQGRYRQALDAVTASLDLDPSPFNAWFLRGLCCDRLGRDSEAIQSYTVCTALRPGVFAAWYNRGLAHARQQQPARARKDFNEAIRRAPKVADLYFDRALTYQATGDLAEAEADATRALELGSEQTRLYLVRARIRAARKNDAGAKEDRAAGLRAEPTDAPGWVARGMARLPGEPTLALADFEAALRCEPRFLPALQNKAHVQGKYLRRTEDAIRTLDEAVALYPEDVHPRAGRGVLRARLGRDADALKDAAAALALEDTPANQYQVAGIYALASQRDEALREKAFRLLTLALRRGFGGGYLASDRDLDPLRADARFAQLEALARGDVR